MTAEEFVSFVKKECKYYGVKYKLPKAEYVRDAGLYLSGYFDDTNKVLACAMKNETAIEILAHEYCHMRQWVDQSEVWIRANKERTYQAWGRHLNGASVDMDRHFDIMRDLELDNEKRTVRLIKELNLPIDTKAYTRKANAYIMLYNWMKITGRWPKKSVSITKNKRIIEAMPDRFCMNYGRIPYRLKRIFKDEGV